MTTVTKMIEALLQSEVRYSNQQIVDLVKEKFPEAKTTTKSVSSAASTMRRFGVDVAKREHANPSERIRELEAEVADLKAQLAELLEAAA